MSLCDQLEQQQTQSNAAHEQLVESLLETLHNTNDHEELQTSWQRIAGNFDHLFTTEHSIDRLKETILQLAVMGKLVPQNPEDEPASELLKKIGKEKARLIKDSRVRSEKSIIDFNGLDELLKHIPPSWEKIRLANIANIVRGGSPRPAGDSRFYNGDIPFLKVADVTRVTDMFIVNYEYTIKKAGLKKTRFINERTVLLTNSGATLGIPAICEFDTTFNDGIAGFIELSESVFDEYLYYYLKSISKWFLNIASRGQGQPNLNTDIIKATWFNLPPLKEQHRIVAKVNELFAICDALKARISDSQTTKIRLAEAVVDEALA